MAQYIYGGCCSNNGNGDEKLWEQPVPKLPPVEMASRKHMYILPDETMWVLNHEGTELIQVNTGGGGGGTPITITSPKKTVDVNKNGNNYELEVSKTITDDITNIKNKNTEQDTKINQNVTNINKLNTEAIKEIDSPDNSVTITRDGNKVSLKVDKSGGGTTTVSSPKGTVEVVKNGDDYELEVSKAITDDVEKLKNKKHVSSTHTVGIKETDDQIDVNIYTGEYNTNPLRLRTYSGQAKLQAEHSSEAWYDYTGRTLEPVISINDIRIKIGSADSRGNTGNDNDNPTTCTTFINSLKPVGDVPSYSPTSAAYAWRIENLTVVYAVNDGVITHVGLLQSLENEPTKPSENPTGLFKWTDIVQEGGTNPPVESDIHEIIIGQNQGNDVFELTIDGKSEKFTRVGELQTNNESDNLWFMLSVLTGAKFIAYRNFNAPLLGNFSNVYSTVPITYFSKGMQGVGYWFDFDSKTFGIGGANYVFESSDESLIISPNGSNATSGTLDFKINPDKLPKPASKPIVSNDKSIDVAETADNTNVELASVIDKDVRFTEKMIVGKNSDFSTNQLIIWEGGGQKFARIGVDANTNLTFVDNQVLTLNSQGRGVLDYNAGTGKLMLGGNLVQISGEVGFFDAIDVSSGILTLLDGQGKKWYYHGSDTATSDTVTRAEYDELASKVNANQKECMYPVKIYKTAKASVIDFTYDGMDYKGFTCYDTQGGKETLLAQSIVDTFCVNTPKYTETSDLTIAKENNGKTLTTITLVYKAFDFTYSEFTTWVIKIDIASKKLSYGYRVI